ncbi:hypothetical protein GLX27_001628 [Malassezia furfur]|uniref:Uncharacterized protein n=1 Tax=Malassezia furfur TaxID=55194 RepID=A0ABY8EPP2_MALFU|nr:hypothetical protein GLX27_001628 [Malassezia furfur]
MDDPGGVRALLAKLREQDDAAVRATSAPPRQEPQQARRPWAAAPKRPAFLRDTSEDAYDPWQPTLRSQPTSAPAKPKDDPRKMTFADALPKLKARMKDAGVVAQLRDVCVCLTQMRQAQHALERTLAKERTDIIGRDGENLRGPDGGRNQARHARWLWEVLRRWDDLQRAQQITMEEVGVVLTQLGLPLFYETNDPEALSKQRRMIQVIDEMIDGSPLQRT